MRIYVLCFGLFHFISAIFWLFWPNLPNANFFQNQKSHSVGLFINPLAFSNLPTAKSTIKNCVSANLLT